MNNFLDDIGSGEPTDIDLSLIERIGTDYGDERSKDDLVEKCSIRGTEEDIAAEKICKAHNGSDVPLVMKVKPLGQRTGLIKNMIHDPGDSTFSFINGEKEFSIDIEIKLRDYHGDNFRPRASDVEKCIKHNRPYLLGMNYKTDYCSVVLLFREDLQKIKQTYQTVTSDVTKSGRMVDPYGGKPYYLIPSFKIYERVQFSDLKFEGSWDTWKIMIKKLYKVHQEQNNS